jgi:phenylpropionate dioxygenase-like ring-hydroxylating dioxygenase large terminal subunit
MTNRATDGIATKDTALIRNAWYVAGTSDEITEQLSDRWLVGVNVLLYRKADGSPVAMDNRCPHRSFPLSRGSRQGDQVVCGYHGMTFAPNGQCTHFPPSPRTKGAARIHSFPVVERAPLVWIWMGDEELADPAQIPSYHDFTDPAWATVSGYYHIEANYVGLHENLQDLSPLRAPPCQQHRFARPEHRRCDRQNRWRPHSFNHRLQRHSDAAAVERHA